MQFYIVTTWETPGNHLCWWPNTLIITLASTREIIKVSGHQHQLFPGVSQVLECKTVHFQGWVSMVATGFFVLWYAISLQWHSQQLQWNSQNKFTVRIGCLSCFSGKALYKQPIPFAERYPPPPCWPLLKMSYFQVITTCWPPVLMVLYFILLVLGVIIKVSDHQYR